MLTSTRTAPRGRPEGRGAGRFRHPFERLRGDAVLGTEQAKKPSLSMDPILAVGWAEAEPDSLVAVVRDAFSFAFFAGGMWFGNVCLLRWGNVENDERGGPARIVYAAEIGKETPTPRSTGARDAPLREAGRPSSRSSTDATPMKRWAAIRSLNAYANAALKKLARRAGLPNSERVSFHVPATLSRPTSSTTRPSAPSP